MAPSKTEAPFSDEPIDYEPEVSQGEIVNEQLSLSTVDEVKEALFTLGANSNLTAFEIAQDIFDSGSLDELLSHPETLECEDLVNKRFSLRDWKWSASTYEGTSAYSVLSIDLWDKATDDSSKHKAVVSCSSLNVNAAVLKIQEWVAEGKVSLPLENLSMASNTAKSGYTVFRLVKFDN